MGFGGLGANSATAGTTGQLAETTEVTPTVGGVAGIFEAVAEDAFIVIDGDGPDDEPIELSGDDIEGDIVIEGLIFEDDTWQSRNISFPDLDPETLLENFGDELPIDPGSVDGEIDVAVDPISGDFDRDEGRITGDLALSIAADLSVFGIGIDLEIEAEAPMTTEESDGGDTAPIEGDTENLDEEEAEATLVSNEFEIPETGEDIDIPGVDIDIDEELGLPSPEGRNYISLSLSLDITDLEDSEGPIPLTTIETTHTDGFISFNTDDPEESQFIFGEDVDGEIEIAGTIFDDGTWESDLVNIPEIDLKDEIVEQAEDAAPSWVPAGWVADQLNYDVGVAVDEPITGTYQPQQERFTGDLNISFDIDAGISICDPTGIFGCWEPTLLDVEVEPDPVHLTTGVSDGPATEEAMEGSAVGMGTENPAIRVVGQEFNVNAEGDGTISDWLTGTVLGTPASSGLNWVDIDMDLDLADPDALEGTLIFDPIVEDPPQDLDGDGLFEDIIGDGNFTSLDVDALFNNLWEDPVQQQSELFTFAGEALRDEVRIADVQALHNGLVAGESPDPPDVVLPERTVDIRVEAEETEIEIGTETELAVVVAGRPEQDIDGPENGIEVVDFALELSDDEAATITEYELADSVSGNIKDNSRIIDGNTVVFEVALLEQRLDELDEDETIELARVTLAAQEPGLATVEPAVESFPAGVFGEETEWYETADASGDSVVIDEPASVTFNDSGEERLGEVVVDAADPGGFGEYLGIWTETNDEPDERIGYTELETAGEEVSVPVAEPANGETLIAAVHPADADGEPLFDEILASSFATANVIIGPPALAEAPGYDNPQDVDDDGLFEHTTGTGEFSIADVQALFEHLDNEDRVQAYSEFYNFSGLDEDRVTIFDVQALYRRYQEHS